MTHLQEHQPQKMIPRVRGRRHLADIDKKTIREAVGVFHDAKSLQAAIEELQEVGFMRHELSVLGNENALQQKLPHVRLRELAESTEADRVPSVSEEEIAIAEGAAVSIPLFVVATTAAGAVLTSGGTVLSAILDGLAGGAVGAGIGSILAMFIARHHARYLQSQIHRGGLLLWVHLRAPDMEKRATKILRRHSAREVHVHDIPVYK
jgi:hypothetical protein